ncbi:MAG: TIM-barrel domain-containing protein, partial [Chloroflexota bacterium]
MGDDSKQMNDEGQEQSFVVRTVGDFEQQILDNDAVMREKDALFAKDINHDASWAVFGRVMNWKHANQKVMLTLENGEAELVWFSAEILRVRVNSTVVEQNLYFSYFLQEQVELDAVSLDIRHDEATLFIHVGEYVYHIGREAFTIQCWRGEVLCWQVNGFDIREDKHAVGTRLHLHDDEACYGTGERAFGLNLRGRVLPMWNTDPGGYKRGDDPINTCISFYTGVYDDGCYGVLWDTPVRSLFDLGANDSDVAHLTGETDKISCYFFAGERVEDVLTRYSQITGSMAMPPLWALGYHQSRYSYMTADEVLSVAQTLRDKEIPCDVIYLDIHYLEKNKVFTWNTENFPDLAVLIEKLHAMNMKIVPILDPGIAVEAGYVGHDTGIEAGVFLTYPDGENVAGVVWPGLCYFPDFTDSSTREWWAQQLVSLLDCGVDGFWNDMNEPLIFQVDAPPADLPDYVQHAKEGLGGTHLELHNVYGTLMAQASLKGLERHRPDKRQFTFTRASSAGAQRVASSWTGDNHSTWDDLHMAITTTLQMGMSGLAFTGSDVGGFMGDTTGELLTRWMQAGAYMPFFRNHCAVDAINQEPW